MERLSFFRETWETNFIALLTREKNEQGRESRCNRYNIFLKSSSPVAANLPRIDSLAMIAHNDNPRILEPIDNAAPASPSGRVRLLGAFTSFLASLQKRG
jgi:hypothetical protein